MRDTIEERTWDMLGPQPYRDATIGEYQSPHFFYRVEGIYECYINLHEIVEAWWSDTDNGEVFRCFLRNNHEYIEFSLESGKLVLAALKRYRTQSP